MAEILTAEGHRAPPHYFSKRLKEFDPNLRARWGMNQAVPFAGWVIERRIPDHMKARVNAAILRKQIAHKPGHWINDRYAEQTVTDVHGTIIYRRAYDMMPDWHEIYRVMNDAGEPILELGDFVIDYLRRNYERTLLGFPELGRKHHLQDLDEKEAREAKRHDELLDKAAREVMDHKYEIFSDVLAFGGQPSRVKEGSDYGDDVN